MDLTLLVGNTAIFCTVASNLAGLPVCIDFLNKKSTSGVSFLPFLAAATCSSLWLQYGLMVGDTVVGAVNLIAVFIQTCYLACYYYSTTTKIVLQRWFISTAFLLVFIHLIVFYMTHMQTGIQILGYLASMGSISCSIAPLPGVVEVFRSRSTNVLPFPIILAGFTVNVLWYVYGVLIRDPFVEMPNLISAAVYGFQLSLFTVFGFKSSTDPQVKSKRKNM